MKQSRKMQFDLDKIAIEAFGDVFCSEMKAGLAYTTAGGENSSMGRRTPQMRKGQI